MGDCRHSGGTLLPLTGDWTNVVPGEQTMRRFYCFECGNIYAVRRENIEVERDGDLEDLRDE